MPKPFIYQHKGDRSGLPLLFFLVLALLGIFSIHAGAQTPFTCQDGFAYYTSGNQLYLQNMVDGNRTLLGTVTISGTPVTPDAIGYNVKDNFIWGSKKNTNRILRISSDGTAQEFTVSGLPAGNYVAGDVDANGFLYLSQESASIVYKINLNVAPYTATTITLNVSAFFLRDLSVNNDGTKIFFPSYDDLYTYTVTGTTATSTQISGTYLNADPANSPNSYLDKFGTLYVQTNMPSSITNGRGQLNVFQPTDSNGDGNLAPAKEIAAVVLYSTTTSDGAMCRNATAYPSSQPSFSCADRSGYVVTSAACGTTGADNLYKIDVQNNTSTLVKSGLFTSTSNQMNALGFNTTDGYLWAFWYSSNVMVRIASDGTLAYFPIDGLPFLCNQELNAGDFGANGVYYAMNGTSGGAAFGKIYKIDLNPTSPTYLKLLGTVQMTGVTGTSITDFSYNVIDGNLYGVGANGNLIRINPNTGVATSLGATGATGTANIIISFMDATGTLFFQRGSSTTVWRVSNTQNTTNPTATIFTNSATSTANGDGAICPLGLIAGVKLSGNVWNDSNGNRVKEEANTVTNDPSETLTVYLLDGSNNIVAKSDAADDGTWSIDLVPPGTYKVQLTNDSTLAVGNLNATVPVVLPAFWTFTGINFNNTPGAAGSSFGTVTVASTAIANLNFGIRETLVAVDDINQTPQGVTVTGNVITNDEGQGTLTVSAAQAYNSGGTLVTLPLGTATAIYTPTGTLAGTITLNPDGSYSFTPAPGFTGDVPVNYTATNGTSSDTATLEIKVLPATTPANDPPVAQNDNVLAEAGTPISSSVLTNDSDPDADPLTVTGATINGSPLTIGGAPVQVSGTDANGNPVANAGTLVLNADGTYTYTPAAGFSGTVAPVTYTISDGHGGTDTAVLSITVIPNAGNTTFANDDANTGVKGQTLTGNVKTNDTDPEGNTTTVTAASAGGTSITIGSATPIPGVGSLTLNADGTYTFVPDPTFVGTSVVKYTACDNGTPQACDDATLYLTILDELVPDLTPFITVSPNDMVGTSAFTTRIRILNLATAGEPTTGAVITVRILKSSLWSFTWDGSAATNSLGALNNSIWTYSGTGIFHTWTTNAVIPVGSSRYIGFNGTFTPGATTGKLSITVQIAYPSGGERNDKNNTDVEKITYTGQ